MTIRLESGHRIKVRERGHCGSGSCSRTQTVLEVDDGRSFRGVFIETTLDDHPETFGSDHHDDIIDVVDVSTPIPDRPDGHLPETDSQLEDISLAQIKRVVAVDGVSELRRFITEMDILARERAVSDVPGFSVSKIDEDSIEIAPSAFDHDVVAGDVTVGKTTRVDLLESFTQLGTNVHDRGFPFAFSQFLAVLEGLLAMDVARDQNRL